MSLSGRVAPMAGTVTSFSFAVGWGEVEAEDGNSYPFHCTAIADGSRHIQTETKVFFHLVPGHQGQWEAGGITPR